MPTKDTGRYREYCSSSSRDYVLCVGPVLRYNGTQSEKSVLSVESCPGKEHSVSSEGETPTGSNQINSPFEEDAGYNGDGNSAYIGEEDSSDSDEELTM